MPDDLQEAALKAAMMHKYRSTATREVTRCALRLENADDVLSLPGAEPGE